MAETKNNKKEEIVSMEKKNTSKEENKTEEKINVSVITNRLDVCKDTDLTYTEEEEAMWKAVTKEFQETERYKKRKFKILLVVYIIMFIAFLIVMSYIIYRMVDWDYLRKLIIINSKTLGTR